MKTINEAKGTKRQTSQRRRSRGRSSQKAVILKTNPMQYRSMSVYQAISELHLYNSLMRHKYLYSMIHPDVAVSEGFQTKLYSDIPLPTASIGFRVVKQFATSGLGTFALTWSPNFFATDMGLVKSISAKPAEINFGPDVNDYAYSNFTYNNDINLNGKGSNTNFFFQPTYVPHVDVEKYRLVSALLRVSYNGAVTSQSGTMYSCAVMEPMTQCVVATGNRQALDPDAYSAEAVLGRVANLPRGPFGDFDLIRNGTWNYSHSITADSRGIECLYVPMDPSAHQFYNNATYYGDLGEETWRQYQVDHMIEPGYVTEVVSAYTPNFGTQLNYVVCGNNLPKAVDCVQVEIFYNFEVIPTPRSAPVLRASMEAALDMNDHKRLLEVWQQMSNNKQFIRPAAEPKPFNMRGATNKWGPNIANLVSKLV